MESLLFFTTVKGHKHVWFVMPLTVVCSRGIPLLIVHDGMVWHSRTDGKTFPMNSNTKLKSDGTSTHDLQLRWNYKK